MKVGLSYSRCVRDIVDGRVNMDDVLVIISRTNFDPTIDEQFDEIWQGYRGQIGEWRRYGEDQKERFRSVTLDLYGSGKLHQPRQFGQYRTSRTEYWLEVVLPSEELDRNPAARDAWDRFQVVAGLSNVRLDYEYDR